MNLQSICCKVITNWSMNTILVNSSHGIISCPRKNDESEYNNVFCTLIHSRPWPTNHSNYVPRFDHFESRFSIICIDSLHLKWLQQTHWHGVFLVLPRILHPSKVAFPTDVSEYIPYRLDTLLPKTTKSSLSVYSQASCLSFNLC